MKINLNLLTFIGFWIIFIIVVSLKLFGLFFESVSWLIIISPIILSLILFILIFSCHIIIEISDYIFQKGRRKRK